MGFWDKVKDAAGADKRRSAAEQISKEREVEEAQETSEPAQERASIPADPQIAGGEPEPAAGPEPVPTDDHAPDKEAHAGADRTSDAQESQATEGHQTYTVRNGDTLSDIGQRFGVGADAIAELNGIENPDLIYPGQVFKIPAS